MTWVACAADIGCRGICVLTVGHFSGGIGLERPGYQLDYAYTPFDYDLGETHNISLSVGL